MSKLEVVYRRLFQFWLIFPNQNYQSRSKECNFNWCWHRTLLLKKKRFSIFENLLIASGTTTKVISCLKIPLTSMRFIASCEDVVPRFQTWPILPFAPHPPDWSLNPLEETLLQPELVLCCLDSSFSFSIGLSIEGAAGNEFKGLFVK